MKDLFTYRLFTRVARLGSFSAAAREVGLSQSQVSRSVAELEADLGALLLARSTRAVVPTEAGADFLSRIEPILAAVEEAEQSVRGGAELRGVVRISMPTSIGVREIIPRMAPFAAIHPNLHIAGHARRSLAGSGPRKYRCGDKAGTPVGFHCNEPSDHDDLQIHSRLSRLLAQHWSADDTGGLQSHRIIAGPASTVPSGWMFTRNGETRTIPLAAHFSTDENEGAVAAATAGLGITSTTAWACRRELESGELVALLTDWQTESVPVHAYFPHGSRTRSAGRALIEHLVASLLGEGDNASSV